MGKILNERLVEISDNHWRLNVMWVVSHGYANNKLKKFSYLYKGVKYDFICHFFLTYFLAEFVNSIPLIFVLLTNVFA